MWIGWPRRWWRRDKSFHGECSPPLEPARASRHKQSAWTNRGSDMIVCIPDVLNAEEIKKLRAEAALLPFVPGGETAGGRARRVKNNEQISQKADERKAL